MLFKREDVTSFTEFKLRLSGMRVCEEYVAVCEGPVVKIFLYPGFLSKDEDCIPRATVTCDSDAFLNLINDCNVMGWDGFRGDHPKNVKDGIMFRFDAVVNDGRGIHADGSENFPKGFHELRSEFYRMFRE